MKGKANRRLTLTVGTKRAKGKIEGQADLGWWAHQQEVERQSRGQADLDSGHINRTIGNCDEEREQVLAGRLVQGEVALMLAHHHHQHLPAHHHRSLRHCTSHLSALVLLCLQSASVTVHGSTIRHPVFE